MAISVISSELKTTSGTLTIPASCNYVVALVSGSANPTINSVAMTQNISIAEPIPAGVSLSISTMANPPTGSVSFTLGQETRFIYLYGAGSVTDVDGSDTGAAVTLTSSINDFVFGIQKNASETAMTVDGTTVTYLDNYYRGYLQAPDSSVICDGDASINAFISIAPTDAPVDGDGTMICGD